MRVKVFPIALGKVILHASSNPNIEVAGLLIGRESERDLEVWDSVTGPQQGSAGYVYLSEEFIARVAEELHSSNIGLYIVGWYHSHPGLGLFMSSIDVRTQLAYQAIYPNAIAMVIDPSKYITTGEIRDVEFKIYRVDEENGVIEVPTSVGMSRNKVLASTIAALRGYSRESVQGRNLNSILNKAKRVLAGRSKKVLGVERCGTT